VIERLGRALLALVRGRLPPPPRSTDERNGEPAERLETARQRLKETIPPPEDD
jgi:hypothetical protein